MIPQNRHQQHHHRRAHRLKDQPNCPDRRYHYDHDDFDQPKQ